MGYAKSLYDSTFGEGARRNWVIERRRKDSCLGGAIRDWVRFVCVEHWFICTQFEGGLGMHGWFLMRSLSKIWWVRNLEYDDWCWIHSITTAFHVCKICLSCTETKWFQFSLKFKRFSWCQGSKLKKRFNHRKVTYNLPFLKWKVTVSSWKEKKNRVHLLLVTILNNRVQMRLTK